MVLTSGDDLGGGIGMSSMSLSTGTAIDPKGEDHTEGSLGGRGVQDVNSDGFSTDVSEVMTTG